MRKLFLGSLVCFVLSARPGAAAEWKLIDTKRIWEQAPHNAFTDLVRFKERWYCTFREGATHVSPDGAIRVLTSTDGVQWESAALLQEKGQDLRDPKLSVMPDGRLMMVGAVAVAASGQTPKDHFSFVAFSKDGKEWTRPQRVLDSWQWLWRVTWHKDTAYGVVYQWDPKDDNNTAKYRAFLVKSGDGVKYEKAADFDVKNATEAALAFEGDTMICLMRRDGTPSSAQLGVSEPPYKDWTWKDLKHFFGGPQLLRLPDGTWVAAGRLVQGGQPKTVLCALDIKAGTLQPLVTLPSGGDTSYPGLVWHDKELWISYYASHDKKTSIYLARLRRE